MGFRTLALTAKEAMDKLLSIPLCGILALRGEHTITTQRTSFLFPYVGFSPSCVNPSDTLTPKSFYSLMWDSVSKTGDGYLGCRQYRVLSIPLCGITYISKSRPPNTHNHLSIPLCGILLRVHTPHICPPSKSFYSLMWD